MVSSSRYFARVCCSAVTCRGGGTQTGDVRKQTVESCTKPAATHLVDLGGPPEELQGEGPAQLELQHPQDLHLHLPDLGGGVGPVRHIGEVRDLGRVHLLVLGGQEHGRHAHQLQLLLGDWVVLMEGGGALGPFDLNLTHVKVISHLKEAVDHAHGHVHGLLQQAELEVDLDQPVDEDGPHVPGDLLTLEVGRSDALLSLKRQTFNQLQRKLN